MSQAIGPDDRGGRRVFRISERFDNNRLALAEKDGLCFRTEPVFLFSFLYSDVMF